MGKNPADKNKKEMPKWKTTVVISHYLKSNGHWGMRTTEVREEVVAKWNDINHYSKKQKNLW